MVSFLFIYKFYEQYDDDEIGALDNAELEGSIQVDSNRLEEVLNDYYKEKAEKYVPLPCSLSFFSLSFFCMFSYGLNGFPSIIKIVFIVSNGG